MTTGFGSKDARQREAAEAAEARRAEFAARNDALLADGNFTEFLGEVADRARYLKAEYDGGGAWGAGYRAALRDLVNGIVVNSTHGPVWLGAYAAERTAKQQKKERGPWE